MGNDVVVSIRAEDVPRLLSCFPRPEFYHDEQAAREAVRTGGQFNVILTAEALKIDLHVANDEIARRQISRSRRLRSPSGKPASFSPPEELIVKKLQYFDYSSSEKQLRDITSMLRLSEGEIDRELITTLAAAYGLSHVWNAVLVRLERG